MKTNKDRAPKRPTETREEQARREKERAREDIVHKTEPSPQAPETDDADDDIIEQTSWERPQTDEDRDRVL